MHNHTHDDTHTPPIMDFLYPTPQPDFQEFERLLTNLVTLAQATYTCTQPSRKCTNGARYLSLQRKISKFFVKNRDFDFLADGTYGYCLEMQSLAKLVEIDFRWIGVSHQETKWPCVEIGEEEEKTLKKEVFGEVDRLVFGREKLQFTKAKWRKGAAISDDTSVQESVSEDASSVDSNSEAASSDYGESMSSSISSHGSQLWTLPIREKHARSDSKVSIMSSDSGFCSQLWSPTLAIRTREGQRP
jgi:hypothetical protein